MDSLLNSKALLSLATPATMEKKSQNNVLYNFSISHIIHITPFFFHLIFYQDISCYLLTYITDANFRT